MGVIEELLGRPLITITRPYWAVKLTTGTWVSEAQTIIDLRKAERRLMDWTNDLVASGDVFKISELWILCPPNKLSPLGNTAMFPISRPGSAFQFKTGTVDSGIVWSQQRMQSQIIGHVLNSEGDCECHIWDAYYQMLGTGFRTNVKQFGTWRSGLPPLGELELTQLGVRL